MNTEIVRFEHRGFNNPFIKLSFVKLIRSTESIPPIWIMELPNTLENRIEL